MAPPVLYARRDQVAVVTLNRPEVRNTLSNDATIDGLVRAFEQAQADEDVRAVVLTGAGPAFCAGGDLDRLRDNAELARQDAWRLIERYRAGIQRIPRALGVLDVPVIAAVNGPAVGAGCDLACMCDIRLAAEEAWFAESFVKLGIVAGDGGAWLLPRVVGRARAFEMALTGDRVEAAQALDWGLVSRVVPGAELMPAALALAGRIARNPPFATRMTKLLIQESDHLQLGSALRLSAAMQALAHGTPDHREAVATAASGKRKPPGENPQ